MKVMVSCRLIQRRHIPNKLQPDRAGFPGFQQIGELGSREKINNVQTMKGNRADDSYTLLGSLATYQCGEVVEVGFSPKKVLGNEHLIACWKDITAYPMNLQ